MAHDHHGHSHGHAHAHAPADFGHAFSIGITLNMAFLLAEGAVGLATGSMALVADAAHNLSDVLGLVAAWGGAALAKRPPSRRFTYGLRGSTILAALLNSLLLMVAVGGIALEAIQRFGEPRTVAGNAVMIVAAIGIAINGATALLFMRGRHHDLNIRGAYLHMVADAAVSAGVVVAGALMLWTGLPWIDPAVSLAIALVIFWSTWSLLRDSLTMALAGVPARIDIEEVEAELGRSAGVSHVHDLHIWPMSTTEVALTAHLVMPAGHDGDAFLDELKHRLEHRFDIRHVTIQVERGSAASRCDHESDCA
jgi:cobalt-zinc-cadmium efflux system protein